MTQSFHDSNSGNIAISVTRQSNGHFLCEVTPRLDGYEFPTRTFLGQNSRHAIAIALEHLARKLRMEAEAEQNVDWDAPALETGPQGKIARFHVVLHYERVADGESKFQAMMNTQMGNAVVENAEVTIIKVDPDLAVEPVRRTSV